MTVNHSILHILRQFGLIEALPLDKFSEYLQVCELRKTPLYDQFLQFDWS